MKTLSHIAAGALVALFAGMSIPPAHANQPDDTDVTVYATVADEWGNPIAGAVVTSAAIEGAVSTDAKGIFEVTVPQGTVLTVKCPGYHNINVTARPRLRIVMQNTVKPYDRQRREQRNNHRPDPRQDPSRPCC